MGSKAEKKVKEKKMKLAVRILGLVVIILGSGFVGWQLCENRLYPQIDREKFFAQANTDYIFKLTNALNDANYTLQVVRKTGDKYYKEYEELKANPQIKEVVKEVIVERKVLPELRNFDTIGQFLDMFRGSVTSFAYNGCIDITQAIQRSALDQGYIVSVAVCYQGRYNGILVSNVRESQAGILLEVNDGWYFVDASDWRTTRLFGR